MAGSDHHKENTPAREEERKNEGYYTDIKDNEIFLIYKEIQMGMVAKSYMRKGFLIFEEMRKYFNHI